jgi:ATP-binding cassette subfamily B protein
MHKKAIVYRNKVSNRTAYIAENINGTFVTKAFNRADINCQLYGELNRNVVKTWSGFIRFNELLWPAMDFFYSIALCAVYFIVLYLCLAVPFPDSGVVTYLNGISIGVMGGFIGYLGMFVGPLNNIANMVQHISVATSNIERILELRDTPPSVTDRADSADLPSIEGSVRFDHVDFAYEKGHNVLEDLCLDVPAGKCIALVGPTGAGKSTIVNLLSRFYEPTSGTVSIDGHDVCAVSLHSLRSQVGVMMQDSFIFSGTIMENIRFGRPDATDAECIAAARTVFADEFIEKLPNGFYQKTAEQGAGLSTGERQLLSFARTVLSDPKILILDEATSSVDSETETKIQAALDVLLQGRTSFIIAHRLSTIKKADCILYISDKKILEAGTHEQLMAEKGYYYKLAKH